MNPFVFFQWTKRKLSVLRFAGVNSTDIGAIKDVAMSEHLFCDKVVAGRRHDMILLVAIARIHICYGGSWLSPLEIDNRGSRIDSLCSSMS